MKFIVLIVLLYSLPAQANKPTCPYTEYEKGKKVCHVYLKPGDRGNYYFILTAGYESLVGDKKYQYYRVDSPKGNVASLLSFERLYREDYIALRVQKKISFKQILELMKINMVFYEEIIEFAAKYKKVKHFRVYLKGNKKRRDKDIKKLLGAKKARGYFAWEKSSSHGRVMLNTMYGKLFPYP